MSSRIIHGDCMEAIQLLPPCTMIFADPPDNLGLNYDIYVDKRPDYYQWLELLILKSLPKCSIFWLSYYWEHDLEIKYAVRQILRHRHPAWGAKSFLWRYTFGQYRESDCASGFRFILRLVSPTATLYPDAIRVESERMRLGDVRAAGPRVPDDVWDFPRVVGNSGERRSWHPTQHPESLMERILLLSTKRGDSVVDLFNGTGTTMRVGLRLGRDVTGIELSGDYAMKAAEENRVPLISISDLLEAKP